MWKRVRTTMTRKIIVVVLTLAAASVVVGGILGSAFGRQDGYTVWIIDEQRVIWTRVSIPELAMHYFTANVPEKPEFRYSLLGTGFVRAPSYREPDGVYSRTAYVVFLPSWLATSLLGGYPVFVLVERRRLQSSKRRRKRGLCVACGYDLRGSPERCPECGTEIE